MDNVDNNNTKVLTTSFSLALRPVAATKTVVLLILLSALGACSSSDGVAPVTTTASTTQIEQNLSQTQATEPLGGTSNLNNDVSSLRTDNGDLLPVLFQTQTELDLDYARMGITLIDEMNAALVLPNNIDVIFTDCGVANAFYVSPSILTDDITQQSEVTRSTGGSIFMCHELTQLFSNFYGDKDQAVSASIFVLMHELGHALVNQLSLPVLGIEESYVDGMAAVFLGEAGISEGSVLAGWFFGSQTNTPFFDTHRAGPQRLGDLACWGVGADESLSDDPTIDNIAQQLIQSGRNCTSEYKQQLDALNTVLGPHLRVDLSDIFNIDSLSN